MINPEDKETHCGWGAYDSNGNWHCVWYANLGMSANDQEIPSNATIRQEYVNCGNPDCQNLHGPYLYAYWKQDKKLKKLYVGKNLEDFRLRKLAKEMKVRPSQLTKLKFMQQEASEGNVLLKQYLEKKRLV